MLSMRSLLQELAEIKDLASLPSQQPDNHSSPIEYLESSLTSILQPESKRLDSEIGTIESRIV